MYVYGLTQKECARKLGVDPATISRTLNGENLCTKTINKFQIGSKLF